MEKTEITLHNATLFQFLLVFLKRKRIILYVSDLILCHFTEVLKNETERRYTDEVKTVN